MRDVPWWEKEARRLFPKDFTDAERAVFEAGIALGSVAHALAGLPAIGTRDIEKTMSAAISKCFSLQPYRKKVRVRLRLPRRSKRHEYDYEVLTPEKLDVEVITSYGKACAKARMRYNKKLRYPLMYVEKVKG